MRKVLVKVGGATLDQEGVIGELAEDMVRTEEASFVVVHGGGKEIDKYLNLLQREFAFHQGLRVTDAEAVEVVEMVLSGRVNKRIVTTFQHHGLRAIGISGKDLGLLQAEKLFQDGIDLGFVGRIKKVNPGIIELCMDWSILPVISPISWGEDGHTYNVNADHAAGKIAKAISADDLFYLTDVEGVYICGCKVDQLTAQEAEGVIDRGEVSGGMVPKLRSAADALQGGVKRVHIVGWQGQGTLIQELYGNASAGTVVVP